jgi:ABC-type Fe3+/spermidine/putrescine transport system ATPase subunit
VAADPILVVNGVVKRYGDAVAVGPVSFSVARGEFVSLLGPSGCGKTTTLGIIAGLQQPSAGTVMISGRDVTGLAPRDRGLGVVFQSYALFPHRTVAENVGFGLRMRRVARPEIRDRVARMLEIVGLSAVGARRPDQLSGGQRQRVALARALVIEPAILLLDEPLSNLDAQLRKRMRQELRDLQQRLAITTLFVTHDQAEAFEMSDRVILLNRGHIEQAGAPEELYDAPQSRFAAEFIGDVNLIEGVVASISGSVMSVAISEGLELPGVATVSGLAPRDPVWLMIRPERLDLHSDQPQGQQAMPARIRRHIFTGDSVWVHLEADSGHTLLSAQPSRAAMRGLPVGERIWAVPEGCRVLPRDTA